MSWASQDRWAIGYREWQPPDALRDSLSCLWASVVDPAGGPSSTQVLPDACVDLIWQSGYGAYIAGPDTRPAPAQMPAGTVVVGARFRPGAGGSALGLPLAELRDQRVDLSDCLPGLAAGLPADRSPDVALDQVTSLAGRLVADGPPDRLVVRGTRLLAGGRTAAVDLCSALAVSERQLRRRFDVAVGYGPKTLHRVLRFRYALAQLSAPVLPDLAALAVRAGYADQAHLTREMTKLAGLPPAALARTRRPA
jgi:AraC-like DNA-binding protein